MPTDDDLAAASYSRMRWNTPLSQEHADLLLRRMDLHPGIDILDLGCGWGELLLQAVAAAGDGDPSAAATGTSGSPTTDTGTTDTDATSNGTTNDDATDTGTRSNHTTGNRTTGIGVDTDAGCLERARGLAARRSLDGRVRFVEGAAADWGQPADRVLSIGAAHTLGGTVAALATLARLVRPGGRVLFGDACWERPPTDEAAQIFGEDAMPLADLVEHARRLGWRVLHLSTADQREWDDFESTWRAGRQEWLLGHPDDPRAEAVRDRLDAQLREYVGVYRGVLGLAYLVLAR